MSARGGAAKLDDGYWEHHLTVLIAWRRSALTSTSFRTQRAVRAATSRRHAWWLWHVRQLFGRQVVSYCSAGSPGLLPLSLSACAAAERVPTSDHGDCIPVRLAAALNVTRLPTRMESGLECLDSPYGFVGQGFPTLSETRGRLPSLHWWALTVSFWSAGANTLSTC